MKRLQSSAAIVLLAVAITISLVAKPLIAGTAITPRSDPSPVQVFVSKRQEGPHVRYRYRVVNGSPFPITSVWIGCEWIEHPLSATFTLTSYPVGLDADNDPPLPRTSVTTPKGWAGDVIGMEEDTLCTMKWEIVDTTGAERFLRPPTHELRADTLRQLLGGETLTGLSILVPQADASYDSGGHWSVIFDSNEMGTCHGRIEPEGAALAPSNVDVHAGIAIEPGPEPGTVKLCIDVTARGQLTLEIFDADGTLLRAMTSGIVEPGRTFVIWDGAEGDGVAQTRKAPAGTYFARVTTPTTQRFARIEYSP